MGEIKVITSGKGGVGKSTVAVGLAVALCTNGKSVLLVDADEGLRCLDVLLGVSDKLVFDSSDILSGTPFNESISSVDGFEGLFLLAAPMKRNTLELDRFSELIVSSASKYDFVIVDSPAGSDISLYSHLPEDTEYLLVCNLDAVSQRDASVMSRLLYENSNKNTKLLINRFVYSYAKSDKINIDGIADDVGLQFIGIVPEDIVLHRSLNAGQPPVYGRAVKAFYRIASRICGNMLPLPKLKKL